MKLKASIGKYLTQAADVPVSERKFVEIVMLADASEASGWREVTEIEKENIIQSGTVLGVDKLDAGYLDQVDQLIAAIPSVINGKGLTASEALAHKAWYPEWGDVNAPMGKSVSVGFRFRHAKDGEEERLYEVIQAHSLQADWVPGTGTESLYKVVTDEHEGTEDDPIPYVQGMAFEEGKYYTQDGVKYKCILTTQTGYNFDLADLPTIVVPVA